MRTPTPFAFSFGAGNSASVGAVMFSTRLMGGWSSGRIGNSVPDFFVVSPGARSGQSGMVSAWVEEARKMANAVNNQVRGFMV
jgi:hypothetical protein